MNSLIKEYFNKIMELLVLTDKNVHSLEFLFEDPDYDRLKNDELYRQQMISNWERLLVLLDESENSTTTVLSQSQKLLKQALEISKGNKDLNKSIHKKRIKLENKNLSSMERIRDLFWE